MRQACPGPDIALTDGRVLKDAAIVSQSAGRVCIRHEGGLTQVENKLPADLAQQYPAASEAVAAEDARREELAKEALAKEEKRSERWQQEARFLARVVQRRRPLRPVQA